MTVVPTGYLKSHPALKQEAQLKKVEQSANELPLFYDFRHACIVSLGDDIEITMALYDFSRPFLVVGWPEAVRIQEMVPTS
jgi:hypothetical protein